VQSAVDACPGMLTLHPARDGDMARIRLPGGYVTARRWSAVGALAREFGDGNVDITARGNVQIRGVRTGTAALLAGRAAHLGLLPSGSHDRARNITASPLAGLGRPSLRGLVRTLDAAIVAEPVLTALPGRFLFAVDDGTGGAGLARGDVGLRRTGSRTELFIAGQFAGLRLPAQAAAVSAAIDAARAAVGLGVGTSAARIRDLPGGGPSVAAAIGGLPGPAAEPDDGRLALGVTGPPGREVLVAGARLGRLSAAQVTLIAAPLRRGDVLRLATAGRIVIPLSAAPAVAIGILADAGLLTTDDDPMAGVTACSGMACSRSVADVRAAARRLPGHPRTHWAGCARGCGAPADADLVVAAGPESFRIGGQPAGAARAGAS
jgi:precorrin-3B synthase